MKKMFPIAVGALSLTACKKETTITEENATNDTLAPTEEVAVERTGYKIGDNATDFSLIGTDDKMHSLSQYPDAKGFIAIFTCNHCPYVLPYADLIYALNAK